MYNLYTVLMNNNKVLGLGLVLVQDAFLYIIAFIIGYVRTAMLEHCIPGPKLPHLHHVRHLTDKGCVDTHRNFR